MYEFMRFPRDMQEQGKDDTLKIISLDVEETEDRRDRRRSKYQLISQHRNVSSK